MSDSQTNVPSPLGLVFKHVDGIDVSMDVYIPESATASAPVPVILWWHGGGLLQGTRKGQSLFPTSVPSAQLYNFNAILAAITPHLLRAPEKHKLCVVSADYRLAPQTRFPGILSDCKAAMDFIRSETFAKVTGGRVDSSRLILSGGSAGGWLALLSGTGIGFRECGLELPAPVTGICAIYPITDLLDPFWTTKQSPVTYIGRMIDRSEIEPFIDPNDTKVSFSPADSRRRMFYGYMLQEAILSSLLLDQTGIPPGAFSVASSLKSGRFNPPPIYVIHGTIDDKVPIKQSTDVVAALKGIGTHVVYDELEGIDQAPKSIPTQRHTMTNDFVHVCLWQTMFRERCRGAATLHAPRSPSPPWQTLSDRFRSVKYVATK